ncbi:MAG TPA: RES family NAD+ phosphorylase [Solirubrobacterales bacterium]
MRLWRAVPLDSAAEDDERGGSLWFPREQQGLGRHDNPDRYGCIYGAEDPISAIVEALARFRGSGRLTAPMLARSGRPLALAEIELPEDAPTIDLDDPVLLAEWELRPSLIATHHRELTQDIAEDLYLEHDDVVGLRWWSTYEATWRNWTLFGDRAGPLLRLVEVNEMRLDDPDIREAAAMLGLNS